MVDTGTLSSVSHSQSSRNSFSSGVNEHAFQQCVMSVFSRKSLGEQMSPRWIPRLLSYVMVCVFVNSGGTGRHAPLLWSLSGKTCGEQTCSVALVFVRKNTWAKQ